MQGSIKIHLRILQEHYLTTSSALKPLALFHLVHSRGVSNALVFTKSAESTARLVKLFAFFEESYFSSPTPVEGGEDGMDVAERKKIVARAYSSDLPAGERKTILEKFKNREIDMYVLLSSCLGLSCLRSVDNCLGWSARTSSLAESISRMSPMSFHTTPRWTCVNMYIASAVLLAQVEQVTHGLSLKIRKRGSSSP